MTGDYEKAAVAFREAIFINPNDPALYNNLGYALGRMRKYGPAFQTFKQYGHESAALNNTGFTCYMNRDYALAIRYYEKALMLNPPDRDRILVNLRNAENALLAQQGESPYEDDSEES